MIKITSNESTQDGLERFNILSKYSKNIKKHTTIYGYKKLCNEIGIDYIPLVVRNKSKRLPYQDYYTPKTMDLVKRKFKCEIDTFGYEF
jgi:hypothetical protein